MSHDLLLEQRFNKIQKTQPIWKNSDKVNIIKIKNASVSKDIIKKVKRQTTGWEDIGDTQNWQRTRIQNIQITHKSILTKSSMEK